MQRKVYKVNDYQTIMISEQGVHFTFDEPSNTLHYKSEVIGCRIFNFPDWQDGEIVTGGANFFSFVSVHGVKNYDWDEYEA